MTRADLGGGLTKKTELCSSREARPDGFKKNKLRLGLMNSKTREADFCISTESPRTKQRRWITTPTTEYGNSFEQRALNRVAEIWRTRDGEN
jgi:uncharacterized caspase-like protein